MPKLTKRFIDALPAVQKDTFIFDSELRRFAIRVKPSGSRSFMIQYHNKDRLSRKYTIGQYGPLTPEQARQEARKLLGRVDSGQDPAADKAAAIKAETVKELCTKYLKAAEAGLILRKGKPKKASTLATDRGRINQHIIPLLGSQKVRNLTPASIERFIADVTSGKTKADRPSDKKRGRVRVTGGHGTAARTVGLLGGILTYAVRQGVISENPVRGVERKADETRQRFLTQLEFKQLGEALAAAERAGTNPKAVAAIKLAALTGLRRGEVLALKWREIDRPGFCLRLGDTKTGQSVRPIGAAALSVLDTQSNETDFVFPADRGEGHYSGLPKVAADIFAAAMLDDVSLHTLRHSFASVANGLGYTEATIAAMLGHSTKKITGKYIHHLDTALIAAAMNVSANIAAAMGQTEKGKSNVLLLDKRRG